MADHCNLTNWLSAINPSRGAINAALASDGNFGAVGDFIGKQLALFERAAKLGGARILVVARDQSGTDRKLGDADAFPFRALRAESLEHAAQGLYA